MRTQTLIVPKDLNLVDLNKYHNKFYIPYNPQRSLNNMTAVCNLHDWHTQGSINPNIGCAVGATTGLQYFRKLKKLLKNLSARYVSKRGYGFAWILKCEWKYHRDHDGFHFHFSLSDQFNSEGMTSLKELVLKLFGFPSNTGGCVKITTAENYTNKDDPKKKFNPDGSYVVKPFKYSKSTGVQQMLFMPRTWFSVWKTTSLWASGNTKINDSVAPPVMNEYESYGALYDGDYDDAEEVEVEDFVKIFKLNIDLECVSDGCDSSL